MKIKGEHRIYEFVKTEHFLLKQWKRGISDSMLKVLLKYVNFTKGKCLLIANRNFLEKKNLYCKPGDGLVIVITNKILITVFWCPDIKLYQKRMKSSKVIKL